MCLRASQLAGEGRWYGLTSPRGAAGSELESSEIAALSVSLFPASLSCLLHVCLSVHPASLTSLSQFRKGSISNSAKLVTAHTRPPPGPAPEKRRFCCRVCVWSSGSECLLKTFCPKVELQSQISNKVSRVRDFGLQSRAMNFDGKEIKCIFIFCSSPSKYGVSFNYECNAVVLTVPAACHQGYHRYFQMTLQLLQISQSVVYAHHHFKWPQLLHSLH